MYWCCIVLLRRKKNQDTSKAENYESKNNK